MLQSYVISAFQFAEAKKLKDVIISTKNIDASFYGQVQENYTALAKYDSIIADINKYRIFEDLPLVILNKANLFAFNLLQHEKAIQYALEALEYAKANGIIIYEIMVYKSLYTSYYELGDYKNAYEYFNRYTELWGQTYNDDLKLNLLIQKHKHETEMNRIELLNKKKNVRFVAVSSTLIIIVLGVFSFILFKNNKKKKALLDELHKKNNFISQQNDKLTIANATKDKFFSIIAHDLKSPFNSIIGFSNILIERVQEKDYEGIENDAGIILQSSHRAMDLLMNLMEWSRSQTGRIEFNPEHIDMVKLICETVTLFENVARQKSILLNMTLPPTSFVFADKAMISTILRNLIANAIKFTNTGGRITVFTNEKPEGLTVSVSDNGVGIPKASRDNLFRIDKTYSTPGTNKEKGTGLGLILCKEFVDKHGGKIWAESVEAKGSTFHFSIPKTAS
ncbi:MAG: hypothetical protein CVT92_17235 [Bacteroidetes bacterium HGW-Bacteroidetes-1]|jgi:signal transduction histidine kinase|nr:MAG: hypothetical protein CVT92_17235 [Bacteroidetes bacterium HGW-Bacteroidetes-1]